MAVVMATEVSPVRSRHTRQRVGLDMTPSRAGPHGWARRARSAEVTSVPRLQGDSSDRLARQEFTRRCDHTVVATQMSSGGACV